MMKKALTLALALLPGLAWGQGAIRQNGTVTDGDIGIFSQDRVMESAAARLRRTNKPANPFSVLDSGSTGVCTSNALPTVSGNTFCIGHDANGNPTLYVTSNNGGALGTPQINLGGQTYPLLGNAVSLRAFNAANYYVSNTGNDANDCQSATVTGTHGPCLTLQNAVNKITRNYDLQGANAILNVAAGTYNKGFMCTGPLAGGGSGNTSFEGSHIAVLGAGSGTTTINDTTSGTAGAIIVSAGCVVELASIKLQSNQTNSAAVFVQNFGIVESGNDVVYGPGAIENIHVEFGGLFEAYQNFTLTGSVAEAFGATFGGMIELDPVPLTITITGTPAYSVGFAFASAGGIIGTEGAIFTGAATGNRALIQDGGRVSTNNGGSLAYLPGNGPVVMRNGGKYTPEAQITFGSQTGLGGAGTATSVAGSNSTTGLVSLNPATGATSGGNSNVTVPFTLQNQAGQPAPCMATIAGGGTGAWNVGSTVAASLSSGNLTLAWNNNGVALTPGSTYFISYACFTG